MVCGDSEKTGGDVTRRSTGIPVSTVQKTSAVREREEVRQSNEGKATSGQGHQGTKSEPRPVPGMKVTTLFSHHFCSMEKSIFSSNLQ